MNENSKYLLLQLEKIFIDVLDINDVELSLESSQETIQEWTSLSNILLISEIEEKLAMKFLASEVYLFRTVGDIVDSLLSKGFVSRENQTRW